MNRLQNRRNKKRFTELLEEFVCRKNCDLQNALNLISKTGCRKYKPVTLAARNLYDSLRHGNTFSSALKNCSVIEFDVLYVSFISFAERCGSLEQTLIFLKDKCLREEENNTKIIEACVYPAFVIIASVAAGILFFVYSKSFSDEIYDSILFSFCFLILFCITAFVILKKLLGTNKLYEAFLAAGFLIKGGESLANAVKDAVNILGYETREGQLFAQAGKKLSYGVSLKTAFELDSWNKSLQSELEDAFFYAENTGGENDVFEKIAIWLNEQDKKRRAVCFKLLEPFFIFGTGIFLLIFLMNIVLPVFNQGTMIL